MTDWRSTTNLYWGQHRNPLLSNHVAKRPGQRAHAAARDAQEQGNGVLAHVNFSQMFESETENNGSKQKQYLARHIVIATVVDARALSDSARDPNGRRHACRRHPADRHHAPSPVLRLQREEGGI
jgi:hypothetical protein